MSDPEVDGVHRLSAADLGLRWTWQRGAILEVLADCRDFVSAGELHGLLSSAGESIGLTTVYRALRDLERGGHVDVVRDETGSRFFRQRPAAGHRHYLICRCCGLSRAVDTEVVERWAEGLMADSGFTDVEHTLELVGVCAECSPIRAAGEPPCRDDSRDRAGCRDRRD